MELLQKKKSMPNKIVPADNSSDEEIQETQEVPTSKKRKNSSSPKIVITPAKEGSGSPTSKKQKVAMPSNVSILRQGTVLDEPTTPVVTPISNTKKQKISIPPNVSILRQGTVIDEPAPSSPVTKEVSTGSPTGKKQKIAIPPNVSILRQGTVIDDPAPPSPAAVNSPTPPAIIVSNVAKEVSTGSPTGKKQKIAIPPNVSILRQGTVIDEPAPSSPVAKEVSTGSPTGKKQKVVIPPTVAILRQGTVIDDPSPVVTSSPLPAPPVVQTKVPCKYGAQCYRKNPTHLAEFFHPTK